MTQRTRLPDPPEVICVVCQQPSLRCRAIRADQGSTGYVRYLCAPCLSVLNGPLEAPVFTGINDGGKEVEYQKRAEGVCWRSKAVGISEWRPVAALATSDFTSSELRAMADALDS